MIRIHNHLAQCRLEHRSEPLQLSGIAFIQRMDVRSFLLDTDLHDNLFSNKKMYN
jgi:hypothetical protein